jgi:hypothetical protein
VDDEAKKHNGNLPGMGGVCNYVNFHVYHYAGNNPVKYMDPTGEYGEWEYEYEKINTEVQKEIRPRTNSERIAIEKNTSAGLVPLTDEQFSHFREEHIIAENLVSDKRLEVLDMLTSLGHTARRLDGVRNKEFLMGILNSLNAYKDYISGSGEGAASALDSLADSGGEIFALSDKFLKTVQKIDLKVQEYKNLRNQADIAYSRYYAEYKRRNIYK